MGTKKVEADKIVAKIKLQVHGDTATIIRVGTGLPTITDKIEPAVAWLRDHSYESTDIELSGTTTMPTDIWEKYYPGPQPVAAEILAKAPAVETV